MYEIEIIVNGQSVRLTDFPREIITKTILALVQTLKDVDEIETLQITLKK